MRLRGREAFPGHRSRSVNDGGALGRENVGLSNRIAGESPAHRKSKVSLAMVFNQGLGGPKANPKGVADGQWINISTLLYFFNMVRNLVFEATYWIVVGNITQEVLTGSSFVDEPQKASFQEKPYLNRIEKPYRKPTQVDKRKYAKVNGLNLVKELGKSVAVSSQYGLP